MGVTDQAGTKRHARGSKQEEDATLMAPRPSYKNPSMDLCRLGGGHISEGRIQGQHWGRSTSRQPA